jgi:hypothetical protein
LTVIFRTVSGTQSTVRINKKIKYMRIVLLQLITLIHGILLIERNFIHKNHIKIRSETVAVQLEQAYKSCVFKKFQVG